MKIRNVSKRLRQRNGISAMIGRDGASCFLDHDADANTGIVLARNANESAAVVNAERIDADAQHILVAAADYRPTGSPSIPQTGDQITATIGGQVITWEARPTSDSEQCYKSCNAEGDELRVFCMTINRRPV